MQKKQKEEGKEPNIRSRIFFKENFNLEEPLIHSMIVKKKSII